jgi:predicted RNase H-like nuclease (RuvC/YqgF family)
LDHERRETDEKHERKATFFASFVAFAAQIPSFRSQRMKLSERIKALLRANLAAPPWRSVVGETRSPARMDAQLEQIRKSLAQAALREKRLQDELAQAEQEGREREAIRLRRELSELGQSSDELRVTLDRIEAYLEVARQDQAAPPLVAPSSAEGTDAQSAPEDADLSARMSRLDTPPKK